MIGSEDMTKEGQCSRGLDESGGMESSPRFPGRQVSICWSLLFPELRRAAGSRGYQVRMHRMVEAQGDAVFPPVVTG